MAIRVHVHPLAGSAWEELEATWSRLLPQSDHSSPFVQWDWLRLWWRHFAPRSNESAHLCVALDGSEAVGAIPIVVGPVRRSPGVKLTSVQTLGSRLFDDRGVFSEYLGLIAPPHREREVCRAILHTLHEQFRPGELVIGWTRQREQWTDALPTVPGTYVRIAARERSYEANLQQGFSAYTSSLGSSTRRSLFHLRSRLEGMGKVSVTDCEDVQDALAALDSLNQLHAQRWGSPAFSGSKLQFHRELISLWLPRGHIVMSRLMLDDACISCLYDIRMGATQYNVQQGFDSAFKGKVSLGLMHLGYAMEQAARHNVQTYDLLAGRGRRTNYKARLGSSSHDVTTIQAFSQPPLTTLYRLVDFLRGGSKV